MTAPATIEFFARLAYASEVLAPGADMENATPYDKLPENEKQRLRDLVIPEIEADGCNGGNT